MIINVTPQSVSGDRNSVLSLSCDSSRLVRLDYPLSPSGQDGFMSGESFVPAPSPVVAWDWHMTFQVA